ncbi:MAG: glycosyltransferase family 4 protein [Ignavibacterium sp.]|nr:glycosyltransferase family 4 protein [Ignavibacterium sp.]
MKIGIDARLLERKITGIGRSLRILLENIPKYDKDNQYYLFTYEPVNFLNDFYHNVPTVRPFIPQKLFSPFWINFILPYYLHKYEIDLLFSVNQVVPLVKVKNCSYVSVVHDVIFKADKSFLPFFYRKYLQGFAFFSLRVSDLIITVSEYSKIDILKNYKVNPDKIKVVYQSANEKFYHMNLTEEEKQRIKEELNLPPKIILYVGMIENRKNIGTILKIAEKFERENTKISFILVGKIGHGGKKFIKEIQKRRNVIHLLNIDDNFLNKLYNISDVFLFPSLYEGFGYPPLEAMQCGLPVVASNNTSLKEIISEGGILVDPLDVEAIYLAIKKLLDDKAFRLKISKLGLERANYFNLEKTVKQTIEIFNTLSKT